MSQKRNCLSSILILIVVIFLFSCKTLENAVIDDSVPVEKIIGYWKAYVTYTSGNKKMFEVGFTRPVIFKVIEDNKKLFITEYGYGYSINPDYNFQPGIVSIKAGKISAKITGGSKDYHLDIYFNGDFDENYNIVTGKCRIVYKKNNLSISGKGNCRIVKGDILDTDHLAEAVRINDYASAKEFIDKGVDVNGRYYHDNTLLMMCSKYGRPEIAKLLIENGAELNVKHGDDWSALVYALYHRQPYIAGLLIENGADIHEVNKYQWTPLMYALRYGDQESAVLIIENGAEINIKNDVNWTPLMLALRYEQPESARLLIEKGANINAKNDYMWTPLMFALQFKQPENAKLLIEKGADVNAKNKNGWTPLKFAESQSNFEIYKLLRDKGAKK